MRALVVLLVGLAACAPSPTYDSTEVPVAPYVGTGSPAPLPQGDVSRCGDPGRITALEKAPGGELLSAAACGRLIFDDQLGKPYVLDSLKMTLDGASVYDRREGEGASLPSMRGAATNALVGFVSAGAHTMNIVASYRFNQYSFEVKSTHSFVVGQSRSFDVRAVTFQDGDMTTPLENRPLVRYVDSGVASADR